MIGEAQAFAREWSERRPKSVCDCGHTGDGSHSQHHSRTGDHAGHGACLAPGCGCMCFTWSGWTREFGDAVGSPEISPLAVPPVLS